MFMEKIIRAAIAHNQEIQKQARDLNVRAGEDVFHLMSRSEWKQWLSEKVDGARCSMEVRDFDLLYLPKLEPAMVQLVTTENPDTVKIQGVSLQIEYGEEYYGGVYCRTSVEEEFARTCSSEAVVLPSGRTVEIRCSGHSAKSFKELVEKLEKSLEVLLKAAVKDELAIPQEEPWQTKSTGWYANWSLTDLGNALQSRYETLVREHAEGLTSSNIEEKIEALKAAMEAAKTEIGGEHESTKKIVEEAKASLEGKIESLDDKDFVNSEIEEAQGLIREAEEALANGSYADAKAKSEKVEAVWQQAQDRIEQRQARVDGGEILINFEAWHRRGGMSGNGDGWVIRTDGSLRDRDSDDVRRYKSDGNYRWNYVNEDELALKWSCGTMRDIAGSSEFTVVKMPVNGLTEAQREAVRRIELEDIGTTENSFGLDPEAAERQAKVIAEAANTFPSCPACGEKLVYDESTYRSMTGEYGIHICQDDHRISRLVNWNKPFDQYTEGRDAQVVASKRTSNGMIEALAYEKWGGWNINLRLRKLTEEELAQAEHVEETTQGDGNFTFVGGRYFKCTCGCQERVTKSEMRTYKSGGTLEITCSVCGAKGKVSENTAQDSSETDDKSMESALDALKRKWGSR